MHGIPGTTVLISEFFSIYVIKIQVLEIHFT
jgi:hypothetical protein